ncbi:40S ribosomal S21 [Solea senegalensis]|nr:40S ribosomal S21 [Solea senegalensis]
MGLMVTVYSKPVSLLCRRDCTVADTYLPPSFKHVSNLHNSSIAPWSLGLDEKEGRLPFAIPYVVCKKCIQKGMDAKTISIQIWVYERMQLDTTTWCKCPFELAVGCTCVMKKQQSPQDTNAVHCL